MIKDLPSWVPDWSVTPKYSPIGPVGTSPGSYRAATDKAVEMRMNLGPPLAIVDMKGAEIDTICSMGVICDFAKFEESLLALREQDTLSFQDLVTATEGFSYILQFFDEAHELLKGLGDTYINGQPLLEVFWRTCLGDKIADVRPAPEEYGELVRTLPKYCSKICSAVTEIETEPTEDEDPTTSIPTVEFFNMVDTFLDERMNEASQLTLDGVPLATVNDLAGATPKSVQFFESLKANGRRFCVTEKGYIGLVPPHTELGDKVCVVFGASTPFLLRDAGEGKHALVGECYMHAMMDGEMVPESGEGTWFILS
jgi:hypothetical protein